MSNELKSGDLIVQPSNSEDNSITLDEAVSNKADETAKEAIDTVEPPDGGWGWVVCFASFWASGTMLAIINIFGILYVELIKEFKDEEGEDVYFKLSWIGSLHVVMIYFMSMFSGILMDYLGIQLVTGLGVAISTSGMLISSFITKMELLYLTYGIILGLGTSLIYTPSVAILGHYFKKRLGLVSGIVASGAAVFTTVFSFLIPVLVKSLDLRNCLRVLSGFLAILIVCPFIWKPLITKNQSISTQESVNHGIGGLKQKLKSIVSVHIFKNKGYAIWLATSPVVVFGYFIPFVHIVNHASVIFPGYNHEVLVMCSGGVSGITRLLSGKLADSPYIKAIWIEQMAFVVLGLASSAIPFVQHYSVLVAISCIMGIADGCFMAMISVITHDLLGPEELAQGIGAYLSVIAIPFTAGPLVAGWLRGVLGSYDIAFLMAGLTLLLGACLMFLVPDVHQAHGEASETGDLSASSSEQENQVDRPITTIWKTEEILGETNMAMNEQ